MSLDFHSSQKFTYIQWYKLVNSSICDIIQALNTHPLMKATVFQSLNKIYKLDIPSRRSLPDRIWIHIQSLALSFYKVLFQDKIKTPILKAIVNNRYLPSQSIRQSYTNLFYSLNNKCQRVLDFIACIICLLSDVLFNSKHAEASQKVTQFLEQIQKSGQKLREYLYILYTFQTLGLTVGKQSANLLFHKYILSISEFSSSLTSRTRINMQMKEFKKNMQDRIQTVNIKQRLKKVARDKKVSIYKEQLDIILLKNKLQLEQENRNNRKFQKLLKRCITQGLEEIDLSLTKKQLSSLKLNDILKTMKNTQKAFRARKRNEKQDQSKSYEHWKKIVEEMKTFCELGNTVMIQSLSSPHRLIKQAHYHIPNQNQAKKIRYLIDPMMLKKSKISNKDLHCRQTAIKYKSMLPEIREKRQNTMTEPNDKLQSRKGKQNRSKQYRHQYNRFLTQRARKRIV